MENKFMLCSDMECAPPYGNKEDCEFYKEGCCIGATIPEDEKFFFS